jgi:hypothetical protein
MGREYLPPQIVLIGSRHLNLRRRVSPSLHYTIIGIALATVGNFSGFTLVAAGITVGCRIADAKATEFGWKGVGATPAALFVDDLRTARTGAPFISDRVGAVPPDPLNPS